MHHPANNYQAEESETWIGEWMKKHNNRDEIVLATKFTTGYRTMGAHEKLKSNFQGYVYVSPVLIGLSSKRPY